MEKFVIRKLESANVYKTIRFPTDLNNKINEIIKEYNKGKTKREYSFNGFVISACEYALKNLEEK